MRLFMRGQIVLLDHINFSLVSFCINNTRLYKEIEKFGYSYENAESPSTYTCTTTVVKINSSFSIFSTNTHKILIIKSMISIFLSSYSILICFCVAHLILKLFKNKQINDGRLIGIDIL